MTGIDDLAKELGFKSNTFRYWLKKNEEDFNSGIYNFNLSALKKRIRFTLADNKKQNRKFYYKCVIENKQKFIDEFDNYLRFIKEGKKRNREHRSLNWTRSAFECYLAGENCEKCFNRDFCARFLRKNLEPPMKKTVRKLLEKIGKPYFKEDYFFT